VSKVVPTSTGDVGVAEAGTVLSWGRAGSAYYWRRSKSLINRQLINGAALAGGPVFLHRAGVPLRRVVLDDHEGGDDRHRREDEPSEAAAVPARQGVEVIALQSCRPPCYWHPQEIRPLNAAASAFADMTQSHLTKERPPEKLATAKRTPPRMRAR
jgi:hypothetical protein